VLWLGTCAGLPSVRGINNSVRLGPGIDVVTKSTTAAVSMVSSSNGSAEIFFVSKATSCAAHRRRPGRRRSGSRGRRLRSRCVENRRCAPRSSWYGPNADRKHDQRQRVSNNDCANRHDHGLQLHRAFPRSAKKSTIGLLLLKKPRACEPSAAPTSNRPTLADRRICCASGGTPTRSTF